MNLIQLKLLNTKNEVCFKITILTFIRLSINFYLKSL